MSDPNATPPLVSPEWAVQHLDDPAVRFVDVEYDRSDYEQGHIPGSVCWIWGEDLMQAQRRDIVGSDALGALLSRSGIDADTHVVLYGDDDWYAAWTLWQLKLFGFERVSLLDGGRGYWVAQGLPYDTEPANPATTNMALPTADQTTRITYPELLARLGATDLAIVDVRLQVEYDGEITAPPGYPAIAQVAGHIPGAVSVSWKNVLQEDGRFKPVEELRALYEAHGVTSDHEVVTYCGVGVRSSHSWYVLHELLGFERARNYDGSWAEWGSIIGAPLEKRA